MAFIRYVRSLDPITKAGIVLLCMFALYLFFLILLKPLFLVPSQIGMMGQMMSFNNPGERNLNLVSLFLVILSGLIFWLAVNTSSHSSPRPHQVNELSIIKKALSADEKRILEEIERAGEITQDSLRYRLQWSKAKVSAILLQLDRLGLVQRERQGKTYTVFLQKKR